MSVFGRLRPARTLPGLQYRACEVVVEDPYPGVSDSDLAGRFDQGDREALNALCCRHYPTVIRFAYHLTQNLPEAEDCTQEAFARFVRSWPRWTDRTRGAGPWLATIVRNVAVDHWHKQLGITKANDPINVVATEMAAEAQSADDAVQEREHLAAIEEALRQVEPACRELIELLFRKGLTQKQAAEALGDSHEAVKKRYQRCLKRLQASLGEWGVS